MVELPKGRISSFKNAILKHRTTHEKYDDKLLSDR